MSKKIALLLGLSVSFYQVQSAPVIVIVAAGIGIAGYEAVKEVEKMEQEVNQQLQDLQKSINTIQAALQHFDNETKNTVKKITENFISSLTSATKLIANGSSIHNPQGPINVNLMIEGLIRLNMAQKHYIANLIQAAPKEADLAKQTETIVKTQITGDLHNFRKFRL